MDEEGKLILRISVRTLVIRFMSLLLILASPPPELAPPKDASGTLFDQPTGVHQLWVIP
jgi:hypothetical protein